MTLKNLIISTSVAVGVGIIAYLTPWYWGAFAAALTVFIIGVREGLTWLVNGDEDE